jgi:Xaa-Pro aminopeptidase
VRRVEQVQGAMGELSLKDGMTIVTEPGVYEESLGGSRWEDNAVSPTGAVRLVETSCGLG